MEILLISARVLAGFHSGMISDLGCSNCDEETQNTLNCDGLRPADYSVSAAYVVPELGLDLPTCPVHFISKEALSYYDEYRFFKIFNRFKYDYDNIPHRMWEFISEYDRCLSEFKILASSNDSDSSREARTESNMSALKSQFLGK